ncbi:MAG TPA: 4Fe-4S dicluster domain-containing protein [Bacteroidota bacterium]|nr:4Fe-4S dicluster domain-containing protein [Bacteroidota bacterium]
MPEVYLYKQIDNNLRSIIFSHKHTLTPFVQLDTKKCKACWTCIENCSQQIINKVDLPWHKHALIVEPDACIGCLNCVNICPYNAYSINDRAKQGTEKTKQITRFLNC